MKRLKMWMFFTIFASCVVIAMIFHRSETASILQENEDVERICGYNGCPKPMPDMLNVHIVPHTHDDVGWLKTLDQYYYGTKNEFHDRNVQLILDSVTEALLSDPNRRFIYVESAFFFKWWDQQTPTLQEQVKQLVNEGRLEFIGGAWSMNCEATTHYHSTVDQFTWGLRRLNDSFGECGRPKIGWQIDPFGHSREFASLLSQMGYDGLFLGRIDYQDKEKRLANKDAEMIWHSSANLGRKADMFTGVLYNVYRAPPGFCFDILCSDEPIVDDENSPEYNVDEKVRLFIDFVEKQANTTRTNNIIITMGDDFRYMDAIYYFTNLERLMKNINKRQADGLKINAFYSTPSCYLKALHDASLSWPTKSDDFFPYASDNHTFWTGYFTSRPTLKRFERIGNHYLQVCKQLSALAPKKISNFEKNLDVLREAMGVMQHHDAVTGTEKQHVANDYTRLLQIGIDKCSENIKESLNQLNNVDNNSEKTQDERIKLDYETCANLNISACKVAENSEKFVVTLYNPLAQSINQYVRIPASEREYEILDEKNVPVNSQMVSIPNQVGMLSFRRSYAASELVFLATEIPPLGFKSYFIQRKYTNNGDNYRTTESSLITPITIGNQYLNLTFDENGLLESAATDEVQMKVRQNFFFYQGFLGDNEESKNRSSGAYIFRPNGTLQDITKNADVRVIRGDLVDEVHQTFNEWISQVVRIYKNENYAEFQWLVGPIPVHDEIGREIITRFDTDIESNGKFYTDSNGREMMKRVRDQRPTWNLESIEKISGNYYPVTTKIAIEDDTRRFAILNDRAQGGSSLIDGSIELMVHRRLLHDDSLGVGEALNETLFGTGLIVRGTHYFVFGPKKHTEKPSTEASERFIQQQVLLPSWLFFSNVSHLSYDEWRKSYKNNFSGLSIALPKNVHLLTFEPWKSDSVLIRFEHLLEKDEDEQYSQAVTFNFQDAFRSFNVISIREATLSANQWIDKAQRLDFIAKEKNQRSISESEDVATIKMDGEKPTTDSYTEKLPSEGFDVTLNPMEIRTFIIDMKWKA